MHGSLPVGGPIQNAVARDITGDALWGMMMAWGFGVLLPRRAVGPRSAAALVVCLAVELSQLLHTPLLDTARHTTLGVLVLGSGFDARDLLAYTLGVGAAALLEGMTPHRVASKRHGAAHAGGRSFRRKE